MPLIFPYSAGSTFTSEALFDSVLMISSNCGCPGRGQVAGGGEQETKHGVASIEMRLAPFQEYALASPRALMFRRRRSTTWARGLQVPPPGRDTRRACPAARSRPSSRPGLRCSDGRRWGGNRNGRRRSPQWCGRAGSTGQPSHCRNLKSSVNHRADNATATTQQPDLVIRDVPQRKLPRHHARVGLMVHLPHPPLISNTAAVPAHKRGRPVIRPRLRFGLVFRRREPRITPKWPSGRRPAW